MKIITVKGESHSGKTTLIWKVYRNLWEKQKI